MPAFGFYVPNPLCGNACNTFIPLLLANLNRKQTQNPSMDTPSQQKISVSQRMLENLHILLWLVKDTCWALSWRPGGIAMIVPTISVAFYLLWKARTNRTDLFHNGAVCCWIVANSTWMLGEFYNVDLRPYAVVLFVAGLVLLAFYYLFYLKADLKKAQKENRNQ